MLEQTLKNVEKYGWAVVGVLEDDDYPGFTYTIGLEKNYNMPEIIIFALSPKLAHHLIENIIKNKMTIETSTVNYELTNFPSVFAKINDQKNIDEHFLFAKHYYEEESFNAVQLYWSDKEGRLPFEKEFDEEFIPYQPFLGMIDQEKLNNSLKKD